MSNEPLSSSTEPSAELIPSSTVLLLRDGQDSLEVLMLRRNSKIAFAGMWVFPGGRVDPHEIIEGDDLASARLAAAREAHEESNLVLDPKSLVAWNHWQPPMTPAVPTGGPRRRFRTWFFAARAPLGEVTIDDGEIKDHAWLQPQEALDRRDRGEIEIVPPTFVTLHELALHQRVDDALAWARSRQPQHYSTRLMNAADPRIACWHGDAGYESGDPEAPGERHRLLLHPGRWEYQRTTSNN